MLQIGQKAPAFNLVDTDKNFVTLDQYKGKNLVLFFFPMAWTGACTKEMCSLQEDYQVYSGLNAEVVGISVDSHLALKHFAAEFNLKFKLLSDFVKKAIHDYDVVQPEFSVVYRDVAKRATFVIDKEGVIRYVEILAAIGDQPNMNAIQEAVKKLG